MHPAAGSTDSPIRVDFVALDAAGLPGRLGLTLAPGKRDPHGMTASWDRDLRSDLRRLRQGYGTDLLVPMLEPAEMDRLGIPDLFDEARAAGLEVDGLPVADGGTPASMDRTVDVVAGILDRLEARQTVVIHCRGGLGRTGMLAACCLVARGVAPAGAIAAVRAARSPRAVENGQVAFVTRFAAAWRDRAAAVADRVRAAMLGLAIGDALGAPIEFLSPGEIRRRYGRIEGYVSGGRTGPGEWTDDTALALATARAYEPGFDPDAAVAAMLDWYRSGPPDVGSLTRVVLDAVGAGTPARIAAADAFGLAPGASAGNGSLMRAAPTGLVRGPMDPRLAGESLHLSALTHADPRCTAACVAFNTVLSWLVHRPDRPLDEALGASAVAARPWNGEVADLVEGVRARRAPRFADAPRGYVLLCLERALIALRDAGDFRTGVLGVVNALGDADTNGAVAGALLGARFGTAGLPAEWVAGLREPGVVDAGASALAGAARPRGVLPWRLEAPDRPADLAGLCACSLPLPRGCPLPEAGGTCAGCPVAEGQDVHRHAVVDATLLERVARRLVDRVVADEPSRRSVRAYVLDLYTRPGIPGSCLPKAVLFALYKGRQFGAEPVATTWGTGALSGHPVPRWPDEVPVQGLPWETLFLEYARRYEAGTF